MNILKNEKPINKTEEILKWRQYTSALDYKKGENSPDFLSQQQQQQGDPTIAFTVSEISATAVQIKSMINISYSNESTKKSLSNCYITLAKESPNHSDENDSETTASYDSYHEKSTEVCADTTDTESMSSYSTTLKEHIELVEYDVASLSTTDKLYSNDSSSGTDEDLFAFTSDLIRSNKLDSSCSSPSDLADTEESDNSDSLDSELSPADYWVCVKCKNRQNNPMFRYCEKCYQIRKSHFPPRPQLRKSRSNLKSKATLITNGYQRKSLTPDICSDNSIHSIPCRETNKVNIKKMKPLNGTDRRFNYGNYKTNQLNSTTTESSTSDEDIYNECMNKSVISQNGGRSLKRKSSFVDVKNVKNQKRLLSWNENSEKHCPKETLTLIKYYDSLDDSDTNTNENTQNLCDKDSGIGSAPSSQDVMQLTVDENPAIKLEKNLSKKIFSRKFLEYKKKCIGSFVENDFDTVSTDSDSDVFCKSENCLDTSLSNIKAEEDIHDNSSKFPSIESTKILCSISTPNFSEKNDNIIDNCPKSPLTGILELATPVTPSSNDDATIDGSCIFCFSEPKNGAFVHSKFLHLCSCYKCAVKIWNKNRKCPICNCAVKNVLKLFVH